MKVRDDEISNEIIHTVPVKGRGWPRRRTRMGLLSYGVWAFLAMLLVSSSGITAVDAVPVAQDQPPTELTASTSSTSIITPSPSPTVTGVTSTTNSGSSTSSSKTSSTTTSVPGTVVTDSPLVKTKSVSADSALPSNNSSIFSNQSSIASATDSSATSTTSSQSPTIFQSPTTNDNGPSNAPQESTYNSLVNFYFLILAAAIAFAVLGWWLWRRRRKGKTTREQRRGLEALRRDLELGTFRRGFLGVVGRGSGNNPPSGGPGEELPAYQSVRTPPSALTRPPEYEEALTPRTRTASGHPLNTIEEEQSIISRSQTPDIPTIPLQSHDPGR